MAAGKGRRGADMSLVEGLFLRGIGGSGFWGFSCMVTGGDGRDVDGGVGRSWTVRYP